MLKYFTPSRIIAYLLDVVGIVLVTAYRIGHSNKIAHADQAPEFFLYLGVAFLIAGTAIIFYGIKKQAELIKKQYDDFKSK